MKSPRVLSRLASSRSGRGELGVDDDDGTDTWKETRAKTKTMRIVSTKEREGGGSHRRRPNKAGRNSKLPRRNVTLTNSLSASKSDDDEESRNDVDDVAERRNTKKTEDSIEEDDDVDDDVSCYSGGSEYSSAGTSTDDDDDSVGAASPKRGGKPRRLLRALNFRRVFSSNRRRRRRRMYRKEREHSEDDEDYDSGYGSSEFGSQSTDSSFESGDDESPTDEDDDFVEAEVAAEELGKDLEAMGYNLNCESFITKGSSVDPNEERYAPPSKLNNRSSKSKKKRTPKSTKKVKDDHSLPSEGDRPKKESHSRKKAQRHEAESDSESSEVERVRPTPKKSTKSKSTKKKDRETLDAYRDPAESGEIEPSHKSKDNTSVGSLSNPSDVMERSLQTNTSSKLIGKGRRAAQKYGHPFSPPNMESLASLRELVDLTKKHKRTIAPPAIAVYEARKQKDAMAQRKSPVKQPVTDDAASIAAMSEEDKAAKKTGGKSRKGKATSSPQIKPTVEKRDDGKLTTSKIPSAPNGARNMDDAVHDPDVFIEGMSVVLASQAGGKRREGMQPYKQLLPDPPEKDAKEVVPRNVVIPKDQQYRPTATHTTATALTHPDEDTRVVHSSVFPAEAQALEPPKKRFFSIPTLGRKGQQQSYAPRVPNLPQTPKAVVVDMSKTPKNESTVKKFQLPAPILTKEEPVDGQVRPQATPSAFKMPSSIRESNTAQQTRAKSRSEQKNPTKDMADADSNLTAARDSSRAHRLSPVADVLGAVIHGARNPFSPKKEAPQIDRFFATVGSTEREVDEETMAPGQIEVTFNNVSMIDGDLIPVGMVAPPSPPPPRKWNPLSPRSRDPPTGPVEPPPDPPLEDFRSVDAEFMDETIRASPKPRLISMQVLRPQRDHVPQPASEPKKGFPLLSLFSRYRSEAPTDAAVTHPEPAPAAKMTLPERAIKLQGEHDAQASLCPDVKSADTTFQGVEGRQVTSSEPNESLELNETKVVPKGDENPTAEECQAKPRAKAQSFDRVRSAPVTRSDLKSAVQDLMTTVFHPERLVETEKSSTEQARNGVLQDWFNLDLLGSLDWAATRSNDRRKGNLVRESRFEDEDERTPPQSSTMTTAPTSSFQSRTHPTNTQSLLSQSMATEGNQRSSIGQATESSAAKRHIAVATTASSGAVAPTVITSLATVEEGAPMVTQPKKGLFRILRNNKGASLRMQDDRMSTGISSSEPSSQYHVEYNDDNDLKPLASRTGPGRPVLNKKRLAEVPPRHQVPILVDSPARNHPKAGGHHHSRSSKYLVPKETPTSDAAVNATFARHIPDSATLSTYPTASYVNNYNNNNNVNDTAGSAANLDSYLPSDNSSDADTWMEIADASMVVERAMERLDTFRSEDDTEDPAKLKFLLSVVSDDDTLGDVEKALNTLRKHASRLGVKETDLLLAVGSQGGTPRSRTVEESDSRSYRSMTLGEELLNIFGMFVKPANQPPSRRRKGGRSSHRHKKRSAHAHR